MTVARVLCRAQLGLAAPLVNVEVHVGSGLPMLAIVGLPEAAIRESKERVRSALVNSGFEFPAGRIVVNLAPADLPKDGGRFDLAIGVGVLVASGQLGAAAPGVLERLELYGELGLAGELRPVAGLLAAAAPAVRCGHAMVFPRANSNELALLEEPGLYAADSLCAVCAHLEGRSPLRALDGRATRVESPAMAPIPDLAEVRGQHLAKRALLIAAAGGHSLLMIGPPGCGKSMLAQRLPGLLPPLAQHEALEVATIASVAGQRAASAVRRPFRAPHHTASAQAIIGGGARARPGEITLAHRGVLFLDELPEFDRRLLESLREPLESGVVSIARAALQLEYPAKFQLVAAMNPCPCGYYGDATRACRCTPAEVARYRNRISGPLLDRIDLRVELCAVPYDDCGAGRACDPARLPETTARFAELAGAARNRQRERMGALNAELSETQMNLHCVTDRAGEQLLASAHARLAMSARALHRVLRVARTIADVEGAPRLSAAHLAEALHLRRALEQAGAADAPSGSDPRGDRRRA